MAEIREIEVKGTEYTFRDNATRNMVAGEYVNTAAYAVGDYVTRNRQLYRCKEAVAAGESWSSAKWSLVTIGTELTKVVTESAENAAEVIDLKSATTALQTYVRDMSPVAYGNDEGIPVPVVTIRDAAPLNAEDVFFEVEPVQDLHGYENPWPAGGGKSLINSSLYKTTAITDSGVTATPTGDGRFTLSGTPTSQTVNIWMLGAYGPTQQTKFTLPAGTYTIKDCALFKGTSNPIVAAGGTGANSTVIGGVAKFTIPNEMEVSAVRAPTMTVGQNYNGYVLAPMIVRGEYTAETFPAWEPYSNICPITGWTGAEVTRTGKNLLPMQNISGSMSDVVVSSDDGVVTLDGTASAYGQVISNETFTLNAGTYYLKVFTVSGSGTCTYQLRSFDGATTYANTYAGIAFTLEAQTIVKARVTYPGGTTFSNLKIRAMVVSGNVEPTDYEPYQGDIFDITFPSEAGTVYGGTVDLTRGKLVVDKYIQSLRHYNWSFDESNNRFYTSSNISPTPDAISVRTGWIIAEAYIGITDGRPLSQIKNGDIYFGTNTGGYRIYVHDNMYVDATSFVSAMGDTKICYGIPPVTYDLTPQEIEMLKGVNTLWANTGDISVQYRQDVYTALNDKINALEALVLENMN